MKILVVDDDEDIRGILGMILRARGHEIDEAEDGVAALEKLRGGERPGMMILDMMMPRLDGEGVVKALRNEPRLADLPVVVLSGHHSAREQAERLGAAGCLVKPIELTDLLGTVARVEGHP